MLTALGKIDGLLGSARTGEALQRAVAMDEAVNLAKTIRADRNRVLAEASATWYRSWYPRVAEASGRRFLHELDDVKDHLPDRTVDLSYLIYRQLLLPFDDWFDQVQTARNKYAQTGGLAPRNDRLDWKVIQ